MLWIVCVKCLTKQKPAEKGIIIKILLDSYPTIELQHNYVNIVR